MPKISLALALIECDIRCMKDEISKPAAWAVPVWTLRMGGGQPMLVMYAAIYGDKGAGRKLKKAARENRLFPMPKRVSREL